jgi:pimeloyl-ACP methyl ester carboxylesterase
MQNLPSNYSFHSFDGVELAWHELGEGRPVVLVHGLFSSANTNWIKYGHAAKIAGRGFRVIMPDLRAHGQSAAPHDAAFYPQDVLAMDGLALVDHLGLTDYDLGGYSLGARTAVRMIVKGATPRRLIIGGMGLRGMLSLGARIDFFKEVLINVGAHKRGSPEWMAEAFLKTNGGDPQALLLLVDSFVSTSEAELRSIDTPAMVLSGVEDKDNGSAQALASLLPNGHYVEIRGNHMSAVARSELGQAIADFLSA